MEVSIPHSEFCSFGRGGLRAAGVGVGGFQFPIRNSVRSDFTRSSGVKSTLTSFNSPFGILFVRTLDAQWLGVPQMRRFNSPFGILFVRTRPRHR